MEKRIALLAGVLLVVSVCSSVVLALAPMGPPRAVLEEDQWAVDVEFAHGQMDLETWGNDQTTRTLDLGVPFPMPTVTEYHKYEIEGLESNMLLGSLGYGVSENWDVFVRLGASDASGELTEVHASGSQGNQYQGLDGGHGVAFGFGTRASFWQDGDVTWGGLIQMTWSDPGGSEVTLAGDPNFVNGEVDLDFWEIQVAVGPTVQLEGCSIYGGPFVHFVNGDLTLDGTTTYQTEDGLVTAQLKSSQEIREKSQFGAYLGAQWDLDESGFVYVEYQFTGDAWAAGLGALWRTE